MADMSPGEDRLAEIEQKIVEILRRKGSATRNEVIIALHEHGFIVSPWQCSELLHVLIASKRIRKSPRRYMAEPDTGPAARSLIQRAADKFTAGSVSLLVHRMLSKKKLTPEDIQKAKEFLNEQHPRGKDE